MKMKWEGILKRKLTRNQRFMELFMQRGGFVDTVDYSDPRFPMGRPAYASPNLPVRRLFIFQDELDWAANEIKEGRQQSADNPYIAPNWKPDEYADVEFHNFKPYLTYIAGDKDFFKMLVDLMEQADREVGE